MKPAAEIFIVLVSVALLIASWHAWPGSVSSYALFCVSFALLFVVGVARRPGVGYLLLAAVLWIGYWLKLSVHMMGVSPTWIEPTGHFNFSSFSWDGVASVSIVGALAVMSVGLLWPVNAAAIGARAYFEQCLWYTATIRARSWAAILSIVVLMVVFNETFDVFHAGLRPVLDLPWPLQGVFGWLVSIGIVLAMMILLWLDIVTGRPLWVSITLFILASAMLSITTYSRGTFALHSLPVLLMLVIHRRSIPWLSNIRMLAIVCAFMIGMVATVAGSQLRRADALPEYNSATEGAAARDGAEGSGVVKDREEGSEYDLTRDFIPLMSRLSIDRWVGLEGVMAVIGYPDKDMDLLLTAVKERRGKDNVDLYTREISGSGLFDTSRYQFATLPGMFAFWYYSGSLMIVFIGVAFMSAIVLAVERIIRHVTHNPFLAGQVGCYSATLAIQVGGGGLMQPATALVFTIVVTLVLNAVLRWMAPGSRSDDMK